MKLYPNRYTNMDATQGPRHPAFTIDARTWQSPAARALRCAAISDVERLEAARLVYRFGSANATIASPAPKTSLPPAATTTN